LSRNDGLEDFDLKVGIGGHQGSWGPVPWVRVFSRAMSPKATDGIYLAYLFAADGSGADLSLQQGSSNLQSGRMRPASDTMLLQASGDAARSRIRELVDSPLGSGLTVQMDLAGSRAPVKQYARQKIANYEHANVLAIPDESRDIPPEDDLLADLGRMLKLLVALYGAAVLRDPTSPPTDSVEAKPGSWRADDASKAQSLPQDAEELLRSLIGVDLSTVRGRVNVVLSVDRDAALVGTNRSPDGQYVGIGEVQKGLDKLRAHGSVQVSVEEPPGDQDPCRFPVRARCRVGVRNASSPDRGRDLPCRALGKTDSAADGCASSLSNPACCFSAVWVPAGRGQWRSPCSDTLVWACSSADVRMRR